jgi:hypothetical protein
MGAVAAPVQFRGFRPRKQAMRTAQALEGMTDAAEFEVLAVRVLRLEDDDCRLLEHIGVNADGKTIANLVDGFCLVPGSNPPRFIVAAFTTAKPDSLRHKWLFDHTKAPKSKAATASDDGDMVKAGRLAASLRKDHPTAKFVVHLGSNRQVDDQIMAETYKLAAELGLEVSILAQSRLRDCLDTTREGQWLRRIHLGIQAELLSESLLREIAGDNLKRYGNEFFITPPTSFVPTSPKALLEQSIQVPTRAVHIIRGASGSGKSATSFQVLREHILHGGIGLWVPGEVAAKASSLEEAIDVVLRSHCPAIEHGAGSVALSMASPGRRFLIVVDDVNRSGSPPNTLRKAIALARPPEKPTKENGPLSSLTVVVPVWDCFWAPLGPILQGSEWLSVVTIGQMNENDAMRCLEAGVGQPVQRLSTTERRRLVAALGYDAILIAMFCALSRNQTAETVTAMEHETMERFVAAAVAETASSAGCLAPELGESLHAIARCMLLNRDLYPQWSDVTRWLPEHHAQLVRLLAAHGKLCRITGLAAESHFEFRHDRILEHYLVQSLRTMLAEPDKHAEVLEEPFYTQYVGQALACDTVQDSILDWLTLHAPLSLVAAIRFLEAGGVPATKVSVAAKRWLSNAAQDRQTPPSVLYEAYRLLEEIDSPLVIDITDLLRSHRLLARARLANGDANAGVVEFSGREWFAPAVTDHDLDAVLDRAFHRHRERLLRECAEILRHPDLSEQSRCGALTLAGFIGDPVLTDPIQAAWDSATNKNALLIPAIWAACRCGSEGPAAMLDPMMAVWATLSDEAPEHGFSDRTAVAEELRFAMRRGIPDAALDYLVRFARSSEALRWAIVHLLNHVDHPIAVRFLLEEAAEIERRVKESGGFSPWILSLHDEWDPTNKSRGHRLSAAALGAIRACWESSDTEPLLKDTAFQAWVRATDDLSALRSIPQDHAGLSQVLWRRAYLGDLTAVQQVKPLLPANNRWFHVIHHIWSVEFVEATDSALLELRDKTPTDYSGGRTDDHYMLAHLLRDIPIKDSEPLLTKHWEHLKYSRLFVQAALYIGTTGTLTLATTAIGDYPANTDVFEHAGSFFGFSTESLRERVSIGHLEALLPYIEQIDDHLLSDMAEFCARHDNREWSERHLRPEFERRRALAVPTAGKDRPYIERVARRCFPSDADLIEDLDGIEKDAKAHGFLWHWCEESDRRHEDPARWSRVLDQWLAAKPSIARLRIVADAILQRGTRRDLKILYKYPIEENQEAIAPIIADARSGVMRRSLR